MKGKVVRIYGYLIIMCCISIIELNAFQRASPIEDARLVGMYSYDFPKEIVPGAEKIVYIGFGTSTTTDPWQSLPGFMAQLMRAGDLPCRCINIDPAYSVKSINAALQHIQDQLPGMSNEENAKRFLFIHDYFSKVEYDRLSQYCATILQAGGILFFLNPAGDRDIPYAAALYNHWCTIFPIQTAFMMYDEHWRDGYLTVWSKGILYNYYDERLLIRRFQNRNELLFAGFDDVQRSLKDYERWYRAVYDQQAGADANLLKVWCHSFQFSGLIPALCKTADFKSDTFLNKLREDFLGKSIFAEIMPFEALRVATANIDTSKRRYVFEGMHMVGVSPFSLFDFSSLYAQQLAAPSRIEAFAKNLALLLAVAQFGP